MNDAVQALAGGVLALALADLLVRRRAALLGLAVARGSLAALALLAAGWTLAAGLAMVGLAMAVPGLAWLRHPATAPAAQRWHWPAGVILAATALAASPAGLPLAILAAGLVTLLARPHPATALLPFGSMQAAAALLLPLAGPPDPVLGAAATLPLIALVIGRAAWWPAA